MTKAFSWERSGWQAAGGMLLAALIAALPLRVTAAEAARTTHAGQTAATAQALAQQGGARDFVQVPGIQRQQIGQLQVTAFLDGVIPLPLTLLEGIDPARVQALARAAHLPEVEAGILTAVNVFLVRRADRLMLIDAGGAACLGDTLGHLPALLKQAGVDPAGITDVLMTHAHPDHVCGLLDAHGNAAFARATVWLPAGEAAFWSSRTQRARAPAEQRTYFDKAAQAIDAYSRQGRLQRVGQDTVLPPGVQRIASPGHTVDHVSWLIDGAADPVTSSSSAKVLFWGDIVHFHAVQFAQPRAWIGFDADGRQAVDSRRQIMAQAARHGWWVAGAHLPFPGIGHVVSQGKGYSWVRTEFVPLPAAGR